MIQFLLEMQARFKTILQMRKNTVTLYQYGKRGAIPAYHDLYVDVLDKVGALAHITSILAREEISITNLQILEAREGLLGVLRISFQREEDRTKAS